MDLVSTTFNAIYTECAALGTGTGKLRRGRDTVDKAIIAGFGRLRMDSDAGQYTEMEVTVRILAADQPSPAIEIGQVIEVQLDADEVWRTCRVIGINRTGGMVRFTMEAEHA